MPDFAAELVIGLVLIGLGWWLVKVRASQVLNRPDGGQPTAGQRSYRSNLRVSGWVLIGVGVVVAVGSVL